MRLILAFALLVAGATVAHAYPQFELSQGAACIECHLSPAGGGLLNDYGRDEAGTAISRGGDGRLLHGAWEPPGWFAIGGDFRFAFAGKYMSATDADFRGSPPVQPGDHVPHTDRTDLLIFPMQADLNMRLTKGDFAFAFTAGVRGVARDEDEQPALLETLASREHYAAYTFGARQLRIGRFFPVFGLRLADHTAYVRRYMGLNTYEEPYALELAYYGDETDIHITGFVPQPVDILGSGVRRSGGAAQLEHRWYETILGGQARVAVGPEDTVVTVGTLAKRWLPEAELLVLAELDLQRQVFRDSGPASRTQIAGYLGASKWATRGVLLSSGLHLWEPDLTLRSTARQAFEIGVQYFAWAHTEVHLLLRASAQGGTVEDPSYLSLLQLHYYL